MIQNVLNTIGQCILQLLLCLSLAPLLQGVIEFLKAKRLSLPAPSVFFPYQMIRKLGQKEQVQSEQTSWLYTAIPWICAAIVGVSLLLVPTFIAGSPLEYVGDLLVVTASISLVRLLLLLSARDSGNGSVYHAVLRYQMLSIVSDPAFLLAGIAVCEHVGTFSIGGAIRLLTLQGIGLLKPFWFLSLAAFCLLLLYETGRLPFERTNEKTLLNEYTGRGKALLLLAAWMKQLLFYTLLVNLFFPWGLSNGHTMKGAFLSLILYLGKLFLAALAVSVVETVSGELRWLKSFHLLVLSAFLALVAVFSNFLIRG